MKRIKKFLLFLFIMSIGFGGLSYAQPKISKENIPSDIPPQVRKQIESLYSSDKQERAKAVYHLGKMKAAAAVPFLIAMFDKKNSFTIVDWPTFYGQAFLGDIVGAALVQIGKPAVEPLIIALKNKDVEVRSCAAAILGGIGDKRAVEPLIIALKDEDSGVRGWTAEALGYIKDSLAIEPLIAMLKFKNEDKDNRENAAGALVRMGNQGIDALIRAYKDEDASVREIVVEAFLMRGSRIKKREDRIIELLILALKDKDLNVRKIAAESLGWMGDNRAVAPLIDILENKDLDPNDRKNAADALGHIGNKQALGSLIVALNDEDFGVAAAAAEALGYMPDSRAVEPLLTILRDRNKLFIRRRAAWSLGRINDKRAVESLIAVLKDEDSSLQWLVGETLRKITGKRFDDDFEKWQEWWEENKHKFKKN